MYFCVFRYRKFSLFFFCTTTTAPQSVTAARKLSEIHVSPYYGRLPYIAYIYRCINNRPCETLPYLTQKRLLIRSGICLQWLLYLVFLVVFSAVKKCDCSPGYNTADMSRLRIFLKHWISMAKCHKTNNMRPTSLPRHARPDQAKLSRPFIHCDCERRREYRHIIMCHLR